MWVLSKKMDRTVVYERRCTVPAKLQGQLWPASQLWRRQKSIETHFAMVGNHNQSLKFSELNSFWFEDRRRIFISKSRPYLLTQRHGSHHTLTSPPGYIVIYIYICVGAIDGDVECILQSMELYRETRLFFYYIILNTWFTPFLLVHLCT